MDSDNISVISRHSWNSIDADRASLEAERQSLYGDAPLSDHDIHDSGAPQQRVNSSSAKARESTQHTQSYMSWPINSAAQETIRDAGPAPPDYAAATAHRHGQYTSPIYSHHASVNGYGSTSISSAPEISSTPSQWNSSPEIIVAKPGAPPRSWLSRMFSRRHMDESNLHSAHTDERIPLIPATPVRKQRRRNFCKAICKHLIVLVAVLVFIFLLMGFLGGKHRPTGMPSESPPVPPIDRGDGGSGFVPHPSTPRCAYTSESAPLQFDFSGNAKFNFTEHIRYQDGFSGNIDGYVRLVPASEETALDMSSDIRVWVYLATTDPWVVQQVAFVKDDSSLELKFPTLEKTGSAGIGRSCMHIAVVIMFKQGIELDSLNIDATHLDIKTLKKMSEDDVRVDKLNVDTVIGSISLPYWSSRETHLHTISGRITGEYALRDVLEAQTRSGAIDILVDPKKAAKTLPDVAAKFSARSTSGSIHAIFPTTGDIPERIYDTLLSGTASSITGAYIFSESVSILTRSGDINAILLPFSSASAKNLQSETVSGDIELEILSPYKGAGQPIGTLRSSHTTISGTTKLIYPQEWEGDLAGSTMSGSVRLRGKDLQQGSDRGNWSWGRFTARKGKGHSHMQIKTTSGNVDAQIGDVD